MGGQGSGRPPSADSLIRREAEKKEQLITTGRGEPIYIPNLSGVKNEIKNGIHGINTDDLAEGSTNLYDRTVVLTGSGGTSVSGTYPSFTIGSASGGVSNADFQAVSGAQIIDAADIVSLSGGVTSLSGAVANNASDITATSGGLVALSGAYNTHAADSSDPHTATLTQTNAVITSLSGAAMVRTGDVTTSGAAYVPNVVFNTTSGGVTASNYPIGSLLVVYTA